MMCGRLSGQVLHGVSPKKIVEDEIYEFRMRLMEGDAAIMREFS